MDLGRRSWGVGGGVTLLGFTLKLIFSDLKPAKSPKNGDDAFKVCRIFQGCWVDFYTKPHRLYIAPDISL